VAQRLIPVDPLEHLVRNVCHQKRVEVRLWLCIAE
jgi:hypothetical protein